MAWFKRAKAKKEAIAETVRLEQIVSVELETHNTATAETSAKVKEVTDNFNKIIKQNGFTLKIHVAAGGKAQ